MSRKAFGRSCDEHGARSATIVSPTTVAQSVSATLIPRWVGGRRAGYVYQVGVGDDLIVVGSVDPEHDAARALLARGITGHCQFVDARTGLPRISFDIETSARFRMSEEARSGLRLRHHHSYTDSASPERSLPRLDSALAGEANAQPRSAIRVNMTAAHRVVTCEEADRGLVAWKRFGGPKAAEQSKQLLVNDLVGMLRGRAR